MSTDEYVPSEAEEWALVDLLGKVIEDVSDEPQFTVSEHALMAAGTIRREWLAAHDARVRRDAWNAAADHLERRDEVEVAFELRLANPDQEDEESP